MNKLGIAAAVSALAVACGTASAADLRVRAPAAPAAAVMAPIYDWTGVYIGIQGGWGGGDTSWRFLNAGTRADHSTSGGLIGGTAGINFQTGNFVFGIEGDYAWASIGGSVACPDPTYDCRSKLESFGTVRGRVGYAWDALLVYGTGGLAFGDQRISTRDLVTDTRAGSTHFRTGWTAGGGVEWGFAPGWSAKVEALYFDLGRADYAVHGVDPVRANHTGVVVRGGVNWRFNWGGGAPVYARY